MSEQNITLIKKLFEEIYNKGNLQLLNEFFSEKIKLVDPAQPQFKSGLAGLKEIEQEYKQAFPDKKLKIDDIVEGNDKVIVRWTCIGTHKGKLDDIDATNKSFKITGIGIYKIENNKIIEIQQQWDRLGLLEQIGEIQVATAAFH